MTSKHTVTAAVKALFIDRAPDAISTYFGPVYIQHSALGVDGLEGVRNLAATLPADFRYEFVRTLTEGDLVVTEGVYHGFGPGPVHGFDVWRVDGDRIVEHWDALGPLASPTAVDGPTEPSASGNAETSRAAVRQWIDAVLDAREPEPGLRASDFQEHAAGDRPSYRVLHQLIAEGDFVYARSKGDLAVPSIINDIWRVDGGKLAEHWALVVPVPEKLPHGNGSF
jgi:predicted SnoaL-like aldol condensation-catalyzing enzyme